MKVRLEEMLAARDRRAGIQEEMLAGGQGKCLACLTLNIAGDVKRTRMSRMLFDRGLSEMEKLGLRVIEYREIDEKTGSEAFWLLDEEAESIKEVLERIEEDESIGAARLFDFDVLTYEGTPQKLSRKSGRKCLLCDRPAVECARSRRHGLDAVKKATDNKLREFCADTLAAAAHDALIAELETTPKPGLVDMNNNGAHSDMDIETMRRSADALQPYFKDAALLGMCGCDMKQLRARGIEADREMLDVTGGVNTHKGMVYSMGLLLAGMGKVLSDKDEEDMISPYERAMENAASLAKEDVAGRDFGATKEACEGFPNAEYAAERLRCYSKNNEIDDAAVFALIDSMARLEDTNIQRRGGDEGLAFVREEASRIAAMPEVDRLKAAKELDNEMIKKNLSPGGSADMLALAFLLDTWKRISHNL